MGHHHSAPTHLVGPIHTPGTVEVGAISTPNPGATIGAISTPTVGAIATPTTGTTVQSGIRYPKIGLNNVTCPTVHVNVVMPAGCEPHTVTVTTGAIDTSAQGT